MQFIVLSSFKNRKGEWPLRTLSERRTLLYPYSSAAVERLFSADLCSSAYCAEMSTVRRDNELTIVRLPDTVCRRTHTLPRIISSFFLSSLKFFFRRLISELAERNSTKIGHMLGSNCDLKTHVQNLRYPLLLQIGVPKITFFDYFTA